MQEYILIIFKKDGTILHQKITAKINKSNLSVWFYSNLYDKILSTKDYQDIDIIVFCNPMDVFGLGFIFDTKLESPKVVLGKASRFDKKRRSGFVATKSVAERIPDKYIQDFLDLLSNLGYQVD